MNNESPDLSVVVAIVSDTTSPHADVAHLRESLQRLTSGQIDPPSIEVIVPYLNHVDGIDALSNEFPQVVFLPVNDIDMSAYKGGGREHHDVIRARGMQIAKGRLVALLEDCALPAENWARAVVDTHESDFAGVGGAIENGVDKALNWSVYFCDFGRYQNPVPPGPSDFASDANTSYKAADLTLIAPVWEKSFREVVVNAALKQKGREVALDPNIVVNQNRKGLSLGDALQERFVWGQSYAATRNKSLSFPKRLFYAALSPVLPVLLLFRHARIAKARKHNFGAFMRSAPLTFILLLSWSVGEAIGYLTGVKENN